MITLETFDDVPARLRGAYLAVGNFDGVHRGHARLIGRLRTLADEAGAPAVALTFDPHPVALLRPEMAPVPLAWTERNVALLEQAGADRGRRLPDRPLAARADGPRVLRPGHRRASSARGGWSRGRISASAAIGAATRGSSPSGAPGRALRSTSPRPRRSTAKSSPPAGSAGAWPKARVDEANELLGRPHRLRGIVTHGAARGAGLGFPTANLDEVDTLIPSDGVYAAHAFIDGRGEPWPGGRAHRP